ncbi:hypothetical protein [[Kitasatospora] papulosa]|uniref:hypothetical protein n=1 Tax=[Kitasatospora] papulosa TaxID=1464011 RepID=UPI0036BB8DE7
MRAAARSTAANSARLDTIMFEAHRAATDAERYARLAAEEERAGNPATGRNFTALAIARAVDAQRTAGVPCTAKALAALIERRRTEAEIQKEARAEREREAAYEAEQRATTGMDADNRVRLWVAKSTAQQEVPSWGWSRGMLRAMEVAQAGKLYRRDGYAWQSRDPGQFTGGRKVARERVLMLANAGFLAVGREADRAITLTPMGETALYLARLHPDGLHPDDRTAHQARLAAGRRRGASREEVKGAARRLRPLDRHFLRSFKRPVTLAEQNARAAMVAEQTCDQVRVGLFDVEDTGGADLRKAIAAHHAVAASDVVIIPSP